MKHTRCLYMAALCGLFLITTAALSGCKAGGYEQITLQTKESSEGSGVREGRAGAGLGSVGEPEIISLAEPLPQESLQTADGVAGEAVAGTSPLDNQITTDSGFIDTDETVYVTEDLVNIRIGCGTEFGIAVQLNEGDSIKRTGYSEGWSRVVYQDKVCYASSEFLTAQNPEGDSSVNIAAQADASALAITGSESGIGSGRIVAIDAGHQAKGNSEKEPVGPGSTTMKAKVATGTEGIVTKLPEHKLTLAVSEKLKRILEERGYKVVMIRESNDVNISNAERAKQANESGASIFVRIHGNSLDNSTVSGVLSMCQTAGNPYNGELHDKSYTLSRKITDSVSAATGFRNRGVQETDSMSGINWCDIPVSIVEMGFMSNPEEDQKMALDEYQEKIAAGIAAGIDAYFAG